MSSHGPSMDVKVLYTLDSSPNHTMVARLGRPVPVEVIIPNMTPSSPLEPSGSNYHQSPPPRQVRFGRIALKACLGAVCMASPELLPDDKRDYIIYAVDPEETMRAQQLRSPSSRGQVTPVRSSASSSRDRNEACSSKLSSSPPRPKDAPTSILVGKGFFNWALDEEGDGETTVTGRVRSDGRRLRYENGREYEEDINVLEVVIKLKESQARSKDKYFNLVRGLSSGSSFSAGSSTASSSAAAGRVSHRLPLQDELPHRFRTARHIDNDQPLSLHSEPDYPTSSSSSYGTMERQIRRPAARPSSRSMPVVDKAAERILSPKTAPQLLGASPSLPTLSSFSATASSPAAAALSPNAAPSAAAAPNPSTVQLLTILHSLQQRSSKSAPEPAQQAQLESLLQQVAQALGNSSTSSPAADSASLAEPTAAAASSSAARASISPALSARPLDSIPVPNSRSPVPPSEASHPGKENRLASAASKDSPQTGLRDSRRPSAASPSFDDQDASSPSFQRKDGQDVSDRICYNCGTDVPTTWRILKLPAGSIVNNPSAEKGSSSDGSNDDTNEPGWKPRYAGNESPIQTDGETKWSACNPCGLYYLKWNNSRPEYVWRKEHATKAYRERKALAEAAKRRRDNGDVGPNKRTKIANSDVDAASPYTVSTPRDANTSKGSLTDGGAFDESMTSPNFDAATPGSSSGRKSSMPRTLSEACHRDAEKLESQRSSKKKEKEKPICKKQADREYVLDPSTGKWRSRRSMRENPQGKRPGRPKGSVKVPQNGKGASKSSPVASGRDGRDDSTSAAQQSSSSKQLGSNTGAQTSTSRAADQEQPVTSSRDQQEQEFRAPMPPQRGRQIPSSRSVNFAQSSPVRPSMNASLMQPDAVNAMPSFGSGMLASPSRDIRFRVPSYLMNSSPGTMLDTLMSEADFDFEELGPLGPLQTPGTLLGNMTRNARQTPSLRRSPRKNPHGTISGQNPYASPTSKRSTSPSLGRDLPMGRSLVDANGSPGRRPAASSSNNNSPVTRSRTRSGQDVLHPALFSSSDDPSGNDKSSNVTSPASPSEEAKVGRNGKGKTGSSLHNVGKSQISSKKNQVEASASRRGGSADIDADDEDGPEAQFVKGPYRKGTTSRESSAGLPSCPASPSLGRATRKLTRNLSTASTQSMLQGPAKLAQLDLPPSSPVFDHPTGRSSSTIEVDGWGRTPSMREIFPTPSDLDWPSDASPAVQSPVKTDKGESKHLVPAPSTQTAIVRRRPLPATVEDGSSSVSGSSPALSDDSPEGNVFDLLEDPYGILAASGFGIDADGTLTSLEIPVNPPSAPTTTMTPTSTAAQPAITADNFTEIQLHQSKEFGNHLSDFSSSGGVGIAAHVADSGTAAAVQIANPPSAAVQGLDASFLANLPPELSNIFASPKKPIPPQIIEMLASPRKPRTPSKGGEMVNYAPGTEGQIMNNGGGGEEQDFTALFNNPDIQALLAEIEAGA